METRFSLFKISPTIKKKEGRKADRYVDTFVQIKQKDKSETNGTGYLQRVGGNGMEIMEGCVRDRNE